ncbi:unnamed protein product [Caenorhabditis bovis]|uniref:Nudix hydrolase domain-containing protein n=1 Tax=Caenorhabditis bovis TaxID=2654633 RepID=A0A8S1FAF9_9PELO|nr:unnamed protein product [Caenorhabditis bovis]
METGKLDLADAESGDHTPETHNGVSSPMPVDNPIENGKKSSSEPRVPDMQLGKCRYVRLHDNVNYVAAGLILRGEGDSTEVLLIQEAKKSCHGKWYMPAGRVEAGETLEEAVVREILEETGYSASVVELLSMQVQGSGWFRFAFYCEITGGELKTKPDQQSLAAQWYSIKELKAHKIPLRGRDFIRLVDEAVTYRATTSSGPRIMPINVNMPGTRTEVLVHKTIKDETYLIDDEQPFPTVEFGFEYFFAMVVSKCYKHLLEEGANVVFSPSHVVRLKCHPKPMESLAHGLSVRLYCQHKQTTKAVIRSPRYHWITVENPETRRSLRMDLKQYRPSLHML